MEIFALIISYVALSICTMHGLTLVKGDENITTFDKVACWIPIFGPWLIMYNAKSNED